MSSDDPIARAQEHLDAVQVAADRAISRAQAVLDQQIQTYAESVAANDADLEKRRAALFEQIHDPNGAPLTDEEHYLLFGYS